MIHLGHSMLNTLQPDSLTTLLKQQLGMPLPGSQVQRLMAPELAYGRHFGPSAQGARRAAVLVLLYPDQDQWYLPTASRPMQMKEHGGQIALPGGMVDAGESPREAALRELDEELGVRLGNKAILGELSPIFVFNSNFHVHPYLAICDHRPEFKPSEDEVAELIPVPLRVLLDPASRGQHQIHCWGKTFRAPHYSVGRHQIWGATSLILAEVAAILAAACGREPL